MTTEPAVPVPVGPVTVVPRHAMVLAAGLGLRLRPLTDSRPKPLIEVAGKSLLDRTLDRLAEAGVARAVVNLHHKGDMIRRHVSNRTAPEVVFSDESEALLETGGGIARALGLLGPEPFLAINGDIVWLDGAHNTLALLSGRWGEAADALLLTLPTPRALGYQGRGDYFMARDGRLRRRRDHESAPFLFTGIQILHPRLFDGAPPGSFSLNLLYDRAERAGRLFGHRHQGLWAHIGSPEALAEAATLLSGR